MKNEVSTYIYIFLYININTHNFYEFNMYYPKYVLVKNKYESMKKKGTVPHNKNPMLISISDF